MRMHLWVMGTREGLYHLRPFHRVVELGGFSAAVRAFRMTPSAVSKLIARLESRLGARLLHRSTRLGEWLVPGVVSQRELRVVHRQHTACPEITRRLEHLHSTP